MGAEHPRGSSSSPLGSDWLEVPERGWREVAGAAGCCRVPLGAAGCRRACVPPPRGHAPSRVCALPTQAGARPGVLTWGVCRNGTARAHTRAPAGMQPPLPCQPQLA